MEQTKNLLGQGNRMKVVSQSASSEGRLINGISASRSRQMRVSHRKPRDEIFHPECPVLADFNHSLVWQLGSILINLLTFSLTCNFTIQPNSAAHHPLVLSAQAA